MSPVVVLSSSLLSPQGQAWAQFGAAQRELRKHGPVLTWRLVGFTSTPPALESEHHSAESPSLESSEPREASGVQPLLASDEQLVARLQAGELAAATELYDRYGTHVHRILLHTLGAEREVVDLLHDVFVAAMEGIRGLKNPSALKGWLTSIAVFTARGFIKRRRRRTFLGFMTPDEVPAPTAEPSPQVSAALRASFTVLERLPPDERIAFSLRYLEGLSLKEIADACGTPVATMKHRVARAQLRFIKYAKRESLLSDWLKEGM